MVLAFDDESALGQSLASALGWPFEIVQRHAFPDGETKLRLPPELPAQVALLRGLHQPNAKLTELMLTAAGARELGASQLVLVSPYLAYMRQDIEFSPGEVVSQRHLGRALAAWFDGVITVDPHLHRVKTMDEVVPGRRGEAVTAAELLGEWVARHVPGALLMGPDEEAAQWVARAAAAHGLEHAVCRKQRHGDRDVDVALPEVSVAGREVVLLDDVASTGRTLVQAARGVLAQGAASVDVAVTHGLFVADAMEQIRAVGVRHVWSTNCIAHESNVVSVVPLLTHAMQKMLAHGG
jgi:ribose-phosphate pyrophosphokinase